MTPFSLAKFVFGNVLLGLARYLLELLQVRKVLERDLDVLKGELNQLKKENARLNAVNAKIHQKNMMLQAEISRISAAPPQKTVADSALFAILLAISVFVFVASNRDNPFLEMANPFLYIILGAVGYWYSLTIPFRDKIEGKKFAVSFKEMTARFTYSHWLLGIANGVAYGAGICTTPSNAGAISLAFALYILIVQGLFPLKIDTLERK